jgi:hypothetical protein
MAYSEVPDLIQKARRLVKDIEELDKKEKEILIKRGIIKCVCCDKKFIPNNETAICCSEECLEKYINSLKKVLESITEDEITKT